MIDDRLNITIPLYMVLVHLVNVIVSMSHFMLLIVMELAIHDDTNTSNRSLCIRAKFWNGH
jgi:hypothetical protein